MDMHQPRVSWNPSHLPSSPSPVSGLSQCPGFGCSVSCIELGLVIYFTCGNNIHVIYKEPLVAQTVKSLPAVWETRVQSLCQEIPWRRKWQPTPVFLPGESHGQRNLAGYSPWGRKESDTTERLHFHFSLSIYIFQCYSLKSSHPYLLPQSPNVCSLYLCLFCCLAGRVVVTILLNSIYMR